MAMPETMQHGTLTKNHLCKRCAGHRFVLKLEGAFAVLRCIRCGAKWIWLAAHLTLRNLADRMTGMGVHAVGVEAIPIEEPK